MSVALNKTICNSEAIMPTIFIHTSIFSATIWYNHVGKKEIYFKVAVVDGNFNTFYTPFPKAKDYVIKRKSICNKKKVHWGLELAW